MRTQGKAAELENDHSSHALVLTFGLVIGGGMQEELHSSLWGVRNVSSLRGRRDVPSQVELVGEENNGDKEKQKFSTFAKWKAEWEGVSESPDLGVTMVTVLSSHD